MPELVYPYLRRADGTAFKFASYSPTRNRLVFNQQTTSQVPSRNPRSDIFFMGFTESPLGLVGELCERAGRMSRRIIRFFNNNILI